MFIAVLFLTAKIWKQHMSGNWIKKLWYMHLFMCVKLFQTFLTLCGSMDCSPQASLSIRLSRQEYWSRSLCPPTGNLLDSGIKPVSHKSPVLAGEFFTTSTTWEAIYIYTYTYIHTYTYTHTHVYVYLYIHICVYIYVYIHTHIWLSNKKNEIFPFATAWMDLKFIVVSEMNQKMTNTVCYHLYVKS